jgi:hypothetical protein
MGLFWRLAIRALAPFVDRAVVRWARMSGLLALVALALVAAWSPFRRA